MPSKVRLLLIGPLPPPIGGVRVLFEQLVTDISTRDDIDLQLINLPAQQGFSFTNLWTTLSILMKIVWLLFRVDVVSFHPTRRATFTLGPVVWLLCKLLRKKCMLRKFGGVFQEDYERLPFIWQWLARKTIFDMDCLMFETKALVNHFSQLTTKPVTWYPNSRPLSATKNEERDVTADLCHTPKFIYLGHVKRSKGIQEIIDAVKQIDVPLQVDIYGPIKDPALQDISSVSAVNYKGVIASDQVPTILQAYDILLLPTYHEGEGYPGVILEAYSNGLPVITTKWNAIPEIVSEDSGILIQPKDANALRQAMLKLINSPEECSRLSLGAAKKAYGFSSEYWSNEFVKHVLALANNH